MRDNIVLIGMPAAGKSTAGVVLAKLLGYDFTDTDLLIQRREGRRLEEMIRENGTDGFLKTEEEVCAALEAERTVIATGGSVVYGRKAMAHLKDIGTVVYLRVPWEELRKRLHDIQGRGVVLRDGQTMEELFEERSALYEQYADLVIDEEGLGLEQTVGQIIRALSPA